jgi:succinate-semialdehyde dehydrogenase/glutarate-semialdehyde dehydrogenase
MTIASVNPTTGGRIAVYEEPPPAEVLRIAAAAAECQKAWRDSDLDHRATRLRAAAEILRDEREELARLMTGEMGKTVREARAEIDKCAWVCDYYAETAAGHLAPLEVASDAGRSFVAFRPLGTVLAIMPWNFPFWQVFRFAAPALMAGNTALLKHASNVPGCALAIESVLHRAGFPADSFRTLLIGSAAVADLIASPHVAAVTLTGSTPAGRAVAAAAGAALKKTVLELGGSDPYVVLEDADLEAAVAACVTGRMINGGQSCIAAKRFVVVSSLVEPFERRVVDAMAAYRMGDPLDDDTDLGPLARADLRDELHRQVEECVAGGARCLLGGEIPPGDGAFYPPTVLTDVRPGTPAWDDEIFGPVAAILHARDADEALRIANDTPFGLGAAVFTADVDRGAEIACERLEAGSCFVNDFVRSDPRLPFGGIKESGYGRELGGLGIREFVNAKTVWIR